MKYSKYLVGLAIAVITMTMTSGKAQAQPLKVESINNINKILGIETEGIPPFLAKIKTTEPELKVEPKPEPPQPKQYTVASGDNLSKIAKSYRDWETDRKSTRLNSSHSGESRMPSSA